jgi:hypothetical protein
MSNPDNLRPIAEALGVAAEELADLARLGDQLERILASMVAHAGGASLELLAECQVADLFSQRLVGVSAFVTSLARAAPQGVMVDVLEAVNSLTLAEQAHRLSGRRFAEMQPAGGDVAFFED